MKIKLTVKKTGRIYSFKSVKEACTVFSMDNRSGEKNPRTLDDLQRADPKGLVYAKE